MFLDYNKINRRVNKIIRNYNIEDEDIDEIKDDLIDIFNKRIIDNFNIVFKYKNNDFYYNHILIKKDNTKVVKICDKVNYEIEFYTLRDFDYKTFKNNIENYGKEKEEYYFDLTYNKLYRLNIELEFKDIKNIYNKNKDKNNKDNNIKYKALLYIKHKDKVEKYDSYNLNELLQNIFKKLYLILIENDYIDTILKFEECIICFIREEDEYGRTETINKKMLLLYELCDKLLIR